jgi:DNA-binding LacI/PurR family transcriptional regulator
MKTHVALLSGVITPSHDNPFYGVGTEAAEARAERLGYEVIELSHDDGLASSISWLNR